MLRTPISTQEHTCSGVIGKWEQGWENIGLITTVPFCLVDVNIEGGA